MSVRGEPALHAVEAFEREADTLRALAHPKRLMILSRLGERSESVSELAEALRLSLPNASQHLRVLRERGVVRAERVGQEVRYRLTNPAFRTCCAMIREVIATEARRREIGLELEASTRGQPAEPVPEVVVA